MHAAARTGLEMRLDRRQWPLLAAVAVWALGASSEQFLLLRSADLGVPQPLVPLVWLVVSLVKGGMATQAGRLADRIHPRTALAAGWLVFAAGYAGLAASSGIVMALLMMVLIGMAYGAAEPAERALVARVAPAGWHGNAFGWYALVQGAMALPAGLLAGWLWEQGRHGPAWAFAATAVLSVLACGLLLATTGPASAGGDGDHSAPAAGSPTTTPRPAVLR